MNLLKQKSRIVFVITITFASFLIIFSNTQQAEAATDGWHIKDDATGGECSVIGNWDIGSKTCALSQDLNQGIIIDNDGITLDGDGHTITGSPEMTAGVRLFTGETGITIKGLNIQEFGYGIFLSEGNDNNTLSNNTVSNNYYGIYIQGGVYKNTLTGNTISNNSEGIHISHHGSDFNLNQVYIIYNNNLIGNSIQ